jgi:membrane associated rhomboid family serine protease
LLHDNYNIKARGGQEEMKKILHTVNEIFQTLGASAVIFALLFFLTEWDVAAILAISGIMGGVLTVVMDEEEA